MEIETGVALSRFTTLGTGGAARAFARPRRLDELVQALEWAAEGGLEVVCAIPGTVGGAVRMNAGAYGGELSGVLERALVVDDGGSRWLPAAGLEFSYRRSGLRSGQVVAAAELGLRRR